MDVKNLKTVLYITYDGLTDPLGQSQILPYLQGLTKYGYKFTILSFEKRSRFESEGLYIKQLCQQFDIHWVPLPFTKNPPVFAKLFDALRMKLKAFELHRKYQFDMVHCRSYIAADIGLKLKKKYGTQFFFDMRGFWADEKRDGGAWNLKNPLFRAIYNYYKKKEAEFISNADYIISLTQAGKTEIEKWPVYNKKVPLQVIPCCADMQHFTLTNPLEKQKSRAILMVPENTLIVSYLGSIGAWYMLDEMLLFFKQLKKSYSNAQMLFITHSPQLIIEERVNALQLDRKDIIIKAATRKEVPELIKASDINLSFIKPVYSKISSSPTKLGEVLSMGIPVICNRGVGDVESIIKNADAGTIVNGFTERDFESAIDSIPSLLNKNPIHIRNAIKEMYSLEEGIKLYAKSYQDVLYEKE